VHDGELSHRDLAAVATASSARGSAAWDQVVRDPEDLCGVFRGVKIVAKNIKNNYERR
jgi:hypothetical protein